MTNTTPGAELSDDNTWGHVRAVYDVFKTDLEQGYQTADKKFAVELLGHALKHREIESTRELPAASLGEVCTCKFDAWQDNPYTEVLMKSISEDYVPRHSDPTHSTAGSLVSTDEGLVTVTPAKPESGEVVTDAMVERACKFWWDDWDELFTLQRNKVRIDAMRLLLKAALAANAEGDGGEVRT